jgi:phenylacetic acid degradation operon negative regulatory protein
VWDHGRVTGRETTGPILGGESAGGGASRPHRPDAVRGPSARAYLLIVLGEYVLDDGDGAWTQTIIEALALVGFEERTARQALIRSATAGWLTSARTGRRVRWRLTPEGREYLTAAKLRLFAPGPERDWDGGWLVLLASVPENRRKLRHRLRTALGWAGFGSPGPGVWISPHPSHVEEARQVLRSLGGEVQATLLHARLDDPGERHRLVAQAWDVADLDARYRAFIERFAAVQPGSPGEALAQRVHLVYAWRRLLLADPGLPPTLLPPEWSGEQARKLLLDRYAAWEKRAARWWHVREAGIRTTQP